MIEFLKRRSSFLVLIAILLLVGCYSYSNLHSPKVLEHNEFGISLDFTGLTVLSGSTYVDTDLSYLSTDIALRYGFGKNIDATFKVLIPTGVYGEIKWQMLKEPILISPQFGISYSFWQELLTGPCDISHKFGIYPTLLLGTEHFYGGLRLIYKRMKYYNYDLDSFYMFTAYTPGILVGASIGKKVRIVPEVGFYWEKFGTMPDTIGVGKGIGHGSYVTYGIGIQYSGPIE